jgi:hypothetical protein
MPVARGKYLGRPLGGQPMEESEHFVTCPACGGWIDCRDLGQVFEHEGPLGRFKGVRKEK